MAEDALVIFTTWPDVEKARAAARTLVEESLAACANIVPGVESIYRWEGKLEASAEVLMVLKTTRRRYAALQARITELHSYEVPEIVALRIEDGWPQYLKWVGDSCTP